MKCDPETQVENTVLKQLIKASVSVETAILPPILDYKSTKA